MKRLVLRVVAIAAVVALFAACSSPANGGLTVRLDPNGTLGYEGDASGVTVTSRTLVFRNAPGDPEAVITGVRASYFASNGVLVEEWLSEPNSLSIIVPAGFSCSEPDPVSGCDALSAGAVPAYGQPSAVDQSQVQLLPHSVAFAHATSAALGSSNWWAEFTFVGHHGWYGPIELTKTFYIVAPN